MRCLGYFTTVLKTNKKEVTVVCYVCKYVKKALLGRGVIMELGILEVNLSEKISVDEVKTGEENEFVKGFPEVFNGLGCVKGDPVYIETKEEGIPYHLNAPRRVALPMMKPLEKELKRMEDLGVIRPVDEPTEWCHQFVIDPKSQNQIRIYLDLTKLNERIKREYYEIPSVNETLAKLGGKNKYTSRLDCNSGYWQLVSEEHSQLNATYNSVWQILSYPCSFWIIKHARNLYEEDAQIIQGGAGNSNKYG